MLKQLIALIIFSLAIILLMPYVQQVVQLLMHAHAWVAELLTNVFSGGYAGRLARGLIALLSVPLLIGLLPAILYWLVKRNRFPYFMQIVWIVWLIQAAALIMHKTVI
jgi:hypothetical protein